MALTFTDCGIIRFEIHSLTLFDPCRLDHEAKSLCADLN